MHVMVCMECKLLMAIQCGCDTFRPRYQNHYNSSEGAIQSGQDLFVDGGLVDWRCAVLVLFFGVGFRRSVKGCYRHITERTAK